MRNIILLMLAAAGSPALAVVKSSTATSFTVEHRATVAAAPAEVYAQIGRVGQWWDPSHSYSGKAENLTLDLRAGGCFCERLDNGGSVEHGRAVYADPASKVRVLGALGPLQSEAVVGVLTWSFKAGSGGTELTQTYAVSGPLPGGADKLAPMVDQVLGAQFDRLRARLER